ncbi:GntR family transcriptional regulator [Caulobacter sp. NIBR2454]|uniref:GntR family transcriptional regulator n=1 Tax=Caulobacter sp. NIBR2454 TaxID=3015996 RepID=UPI0022B6718B|nr:GntR family transcriptional regulator [Caulobacter sp. NIBR2454]
MTPHNDAIGQGQEQAAATSAADVADALRRQIQDGYLPPGEWLREARICSEFSVGRSLARTALRSLADDGLVNIEENRGAYVAATTIQEVFDLYEVRAALYGAAARFACARADARFMAETLRMIDVMLAASENGGTPEELIRQSEAIFSRLSSVSSPDAQRMIDSVRRKTRWHYSYVGLAESTGPFEHWLVVRAGLAARDGAMASEGARNILYFMQNEAMRLMIASGHGLQPAPDVRPRARRKSA